jgi:UDP-glucuronate decarboxylase
MVDGLVRLMEAEGLTSPVNLGNPREVTVLELAEAVLRLTASASSVVRQPLPSDDPVRRRPDISLAKSRLGWEPKVSLEEGLGLTVEYFRSKL